MKRVGVIVAMQAEFKLLTSLFDTAGEEQVASMHFVQGEPDGVEVVVVRSGIGKVCAALAAGEMIRRYAPNVILNTGIAGGIDPDLQVMDLVVGREMVYHDVWCGDGNACGQVQGLPARFLSDPFLLEQTLSVEHEGRVIPGLICTGDQFITDQDNLQRIKRSFPEGLAVDMESCAIAQVCYLYGVPFLSYRLISDTPGQTDDHSRQYRNFWEEAPGRSFKVLRDLITMIGKIA